MTILVPSPCRSLPYRPPSDDLDDVAELFIESLTEISGSYSFFMKSSMTDIPPSAIPGLLSEECFHFATPILVIFRAILLWKDPV